MKKIIMALIIIGIIIVVFGAGWYYINKKIPVNSFLNEGPGGCKLSECEEFCRNNPQECQAWCERNPKICQQIMTMESGEDYRRAVQPPSTKITYEKTVNFNSGQFTGQDIIKAKNLGANIVTIWPASRIDRDEFYFYPNVEGTSNMINIAYENGLHVELRTSFGGGKAQNYEKFKANALVFVAEYAKFAEENKVYRIVPFGEIDNHMFDHCNKITEFAKEILEEMRKHYSGEIGVGIVAPWRDCNYKFEDYDYLTFSAYPQVQIGTDKWLTPNENADLRNVDNSNLIALTAWARSVADRSDISVLHLGETGVLNIGESDPTGFGFETVEVTEEKEAEFYDKVFSQAGQKVDGVSVFYNSRVEFMSVNGDPAEEVVMNWYAKL